MLLHKIFDFLARKWTSSGSSHGCSQTLLVPKTHIKPCRCFDAFVMYKYFPKWEHHFSIVTVERLYNLVCLFFGSSLGFRAWHEKYVCGPFRESVTFNSISVREMRQLGKSTFLHVIKLLHRAALEMHISSRNGRNMEICLSGITERSQLPPSPPPQDGSRLLQVAPETSSWAQLAPLSSYQLAISQLHTSY